MESTGTTTGDLPAYLETTGTVQPVGSDGYLTLATGTFYVPIGGARGALLESIQLVCNAAIALTATIETCNMPRDPIQGPAAVADFEATAATNWVKENPTTVYVATGGSGWVWTLLTGVFTAGAVGSSMIHLGNFGARRMRAKLVVTTGGKIRINTAGKE